MTVIGLVGLGAMGSRMGHRLLDQGYSLVVCDADPTAARRLEELGAAARETPREVADQAQVVLVSLPSTKAVRSVALGPGGLIHGSAIEIYVDLSTTGGPVAREVARSLTAAGIGCVDSPVSGGPTGAEQQTLTMIVSGRPEHVAVARPVLQALGKNILLVGTEPGQGQAVKVINNLLMAGALALTGEAVSLGVKAGLDPATILEVINVSTGQNHAASTKFPAQVLTGEYNHGFRLSLLKKDVHLCLDQAQELGVPMLIGSIVDQVVELAAARNDETADCTEVVRMIEGWSDVQIARPRE